GLAQFRERLGVPQERDAPPGPDVVREGRSHGSLSRFIEAELHLLLPQLLLVFPLRQPGLEELTGRVGGGLHRQIGPVPDEPAEDAARSRMRYERGAVKCTRELDPTPLVTGTDHEHGLVEVTAHGRPGDSPPRPRPGQWRYSIEDPLLLLA